MAVSGTATLTTAEQVATPSARHGSEGFTERAAEQVADPAEVPEMETATAGPHATVV
jgi:hypothetical protein